jgi:hypothetical protein
MKTWVRAHLELFTIPQKGDAKLASIWVLQFRDNR